MFNSLLPTLVAYLNHSLFPWLISLLILIFAFSIWVFFRIFRLAPIIRQLQAAINIIEKQSNETFASEFYLIDKSIKQLPLIQHQWCLFKHFLISKEKSSNEGLSTPDKQQNVEITYQQSPDYFFNLKTLVATHINIRFYQGAPTLFIQMGLLFTFFGLLVALYAVGNGLISDELTQLRASLQTLLTAATFKFLTSLSGILAAIVFSWREKYHWHRLIQLINQLNQTIEVKVKPAKDYHQNIVAEQEQKTRYHVSNTPIQTHNLQLEDIDNGLLISLNLGFTSIKKEIQRLNTGVAIATRRLYKAVNSLNKEKMEQDTKQSEEREANTKKDTKDD
jgi:hypothetical protein